jgi:hypothetical protein
MQILVLLGMDFDAVVVFVTILRSFLVAKTSSIWQQVEPSRLSNEVSFTYSRGILLIISIKTVLKHAQIFCLVCNTLQ